MIASKELKFMPDQILFTGNETMKEITLPKYIIDNALDGLRLAANILDSRKRETAADRQIDFAERLLKWVEAGQIGEAPKWIP